MSHALHSHALHSHALHSHALHSHALHSHALHSHALPNRAILLIRDYSRPMTRPDWRKSKPIITTYRLYLHVKRVIYINNYTRYDTLYHNVLYGINGTEWYFAYYYINCYGLSCYNNDFKYNLLKLDVDGLQDALTQFTIHDTLYNFI